MRSLIEFCSFQLVTCCRC